MIQLPIDASTFPKQGCFQRTQDVSLKAIYFTFPPSMLASRFSSNGELK